MDGKNINFNDSLQETVWKKYWDYVLKCMCVQSFWELIMCIITKFNDLLEIF